jgi:hypothetical protein
MGSSANEKVVTSHASGTFDVKIVPQAGEDEANGSIGRMSIDKQFHGDLEGTSKGQMLAMGRVKGSGSFVLQHSGTMKPGALQLSVTVVPESGTGQLEGLAGTMNIKIDAGKHSYDFEYALPETQ